MAEFFDWDYVQSFGVPVTGIIHIGAHYGEEAEEYSHVTPNVVWFEAHPEYAKKMFEHVEKFGQHGIGAALSDVDNEMVEFYITADEVASSMLKPEVHQEMHPHAYLTGENIEVETWRFDTVWSGLTVYDTNGIEVPISDQGYNALVLDTQGSEMKVLQGMGDYFQMFDIIVTEYSTVEFYSGGARLHEIEAFLSDFTRVFPDEPSHHGDALFIRTNFLGMCG